MPGGDSTLQIIIKAVDQATGVFKSVEASVNKTQQSFTDTAAASTKFAVGLGIAATAAGGLGYSALKAAGDMEQTTVAFTTMLGSGEKAQAFIAQLIQFAKTTPFTLVGLEDASKQLLAYGITQEKIIPDLTAIGNIAAGVGMDKLPLLIMAFGQVSAKTRLMGDDLRQFTNAGVPLLDILAQQFHKSVPEIQDMITAGEVGFPAVEAALKSLSGEGGRFNNLMEKQSHTLEGMISNLQDAWNIFLTGQGQKLLDWAKAFTDTMIYFVQNVLPPLIEKISVVVDWFGKHKAAIIIIAGAITGMLIPAIISMTLALAAAALALAPWAIGGAIVGAAVAGILWIVRHWDMLASTAIDVWNAITRTIRGAVDAVGASVTNGLQAVSGAWNSVWNNIVAVVKTTLDLIVGSIAIFLDWLVPGWQADIAAVEQAWTATWNEIGAFTASTLTSVKSAILVALGAMDAAISGALGTIQTAWDKVWGAMRDFFVGIWSPIRGAVSDAFDFIAEKIQTVIDLYDELVGKLTTPVKAAGGVLNGVGTTIGDFLSSAISRGANILHFDQGGIVPGPVGAAVPIIAHGQETILPANNASRGSSAQPVYQVNIYSPQVRSRSDVDYMRTQFEAAMRDIVRGHKLQTV